MLVKFLDGTEREIADLSGANLSGANLIHIVGSRHMVYITAEEIQIGGIRGPHEWWVENRSAAGEREGYTKEQIEEYGWYIELAGKIQAAWSATGKFRRRGPRREN